MYQRNMGRNSLGEVSIGSDRSVEKKRSSLPRAPSLDSLGNASSTSGSKSSSHKNGEVKSSSDRSPKNGDRESGKMDYKNNMDEFQEISDERNAPSVDDGVLSDVDSIEDPQEGRRVTTTQVQIHAPKASHLDFDDDEAVVQSEIPKDPVVTAYLEKASHICQNNSCVKSMVQFNARDEGISVEEGTGEDAIVPNSGVNGPVGSGLLLPAANGGKNRRTSLSSGSVGRMETIVEEPIEAKVSVKEILARFETLRESAEVIMHLGLSLCLCVNLWIR